MKLFRLDSHTFTRKYEHIGYIYNQLSRKDMILDEVGAEFLLTFGRHPTSINEAINKLSLKFEDVPRCELEKDFIQFTVELESYGFVVTGESQLVLDKNDRSFSYANPPKTTKKNEWNTIIDSQEYLIEHFNKYPRPFRAHIELTTKCNLECIHCYFPPNNSNEEISKKTIFSFLDQLESLGTLEVVFTGGEALLRKDLVQILLYARSKDLSIILLTNGTLIDSETAQSFKTLNLALVQISLYSMDPSIHNEITGSPDSWNKTIEAIDSLITNNIRIEIACPIIKQNINSYQQVREYGESIGASVSHDLAIMAREDFSHENIDHRVDISTIQDLVKSRNEINDPPDNNKKTSEKYRPNDPVCGMARSLICLSSNGTYYPCPGFRLPLGSIYENTVSDVWNNSTEVDTLRSITNSSFTKCMTCDYLDFCVICPAKFYNESGGDLFKVAEYYCEIAKAEKNMSE